MNRSFILENNTPFFNRQAAYFVSLARGIKSLGLSGMLAPIRFDSLGTIVIVLF